MLKEGGQRIIEQYALHEGDTGSAKVRITVLTKRISDLIDHLKIHKKGHHPRHGLLKMTRQGRSMLRYLTRTDIVRYRAIVEKLNIHK